MASVGGSGGTRKMEVPDSSLDLMNASLRRRYRDLPTKGENTDSPAVEGTGGAASSVKAARGSRSASESGAGRKVASQQSPVGRDRKAKRARGFGWNAETENPEGESLFDEGSFLPVAAPEVSFSDLGGLQGVAEELMRLVALPLCRPEIFSHVFGSENETGGLGLPKGILLVGPSGCGKTVLANALARWLQDHLSVSYFRISAPELVSGYSGESEAKIRGLFRAAGNYAPSLVFVDEIDAIVPRRDSVQREMERRMVSQLLTCIDDLSTTTKGAGCVVVLGATNRPHAIDPALRANGRLEREILLGVPDVGGRQEILTILTRGMALAPDVDLGEAAQLVPGFVGADLRSVVREAATCAVDRFVLNNFGDLRDRQTAMDDDVAEVVGPSSVDGRVPQRLRAWQIEAALLAEADDVARRMQDGVQGLKVERSDFLAAIRVVLPAVKREGFVTVPNVSWDDVGALRDVRAELNDAVVQHIQFPALYERFNLKKSAGVLLYGPPGCGKTLLAKAISTESRANFLSVKGPELLNKFVGESERAVRQVFERARAAAPCIIFFDELDALVPERSGGSGNMVSERVVNQLLTEMDGLSERRDVFVIGATNRSDMIDRALLRPGRFDKLLYVPLPTTEDRVDILRALSRETPLDAAVDLPAVARDRRANGFSGADLAGVLREASLAAVRRVVKVLRESLGENGLHRYESLRSLWGTEEANGAYAGEFCVRQADLDEALSTVRPSVSPEVIDRFRTSG